MKLVIVVRLEFHEVDHSRLAFHEGDLSRLVFH